MLSCRIRHTEFLFLWIKSYGVIIQMKLFSQNFFVAQIMLLPILIFYTEKLKNEV